MKKHLLSVIALSAASCFCALGQGTTGTTTITRNFVFPPVGLASGDTAEVDLVNIEPVAPMPSSGTAPLCTGTVTFASATGVTLGKAMPFSSSSGQIAAVTLPPSASDITGVRGVILVSVQQTTTVPSTAPCSLVFSLQTYDSSGITHVFLGNASTTTPSPVTYGAGGGR